MFDRSLFWGKVRDERVIEQMLRVPRHLFVPEEEMEFAYDDHPLAIGLGQTISQPSLVAIMTEALELRPTDKVLEVGCGSGYQAAILGGLCAEVHTIELLEPLATAARKRLARLGFRNVTVHQGDGALGLPELAPFDAILVAAATRPIPPALLQQLRPGGRLIMPVGFSGEFQELVLLRKDLQGELHSRTMGSVVFVPLVHAPSNDQT